MNAKKLFGHWDEVREGLFASLDRITNDQLLFTPREGLRSLGLIALHIADAEDGWIGYVVKREYEEWPPDSALENHPTITKVKSRLTEVHARTEKFLEGMDEAELDRMVETSWGSRLPLRWIIWHVLEHEIHHRGEIFLMLGLLGLEAPDV